MKRFWFIMLAVFVAITILALASLSGRTITQTVLGADISGYYAQAIPGSGPGSDARQKEYKPFCPETGLTNDVVSCTTCHAIDGWVLKEIWPSDRLKHANWIVEKDGEKQGYYLLTNVHAHGMKEFLDYMDHHEINFVTIEVQSTGGGLTDMWRIKGLWQAWEKKGGTVRTEVHGIAFSAGFLLMTSGSLGHRFVSPTAEIMWHEVQGWRQPGIDTPSSIEHQGDIFRHLQDTANEWIASRSHGKITKEKLDEKVKNKEFWINGRQALEFGFADGFIGE